VDLEFFILFFILAKLKENIPERIKLVDFLPPSAFLPSLTWP